MTLVKTKFKHDLKKKTKLTNLKPKNKKSTRCRQHSKRAYHIWWTSAKILYVSKLFTLMIQSSYILQGLIIGVIIPIHKRNKPISECKGNRPITLLPILYKYKMFEGIFIVSITPGPLQTGNASQTTYKTPNKNKKVL